MQPPSRDDPVCAPQSLCECVRISPADSPFPVDFSVMTTVRAVKGSQVFLLSLYDSQVTHRTRYGDRSQTYMFNSSTDFCLFSYHSNVDPLGLHVPPPSLIDSHHPLSRPSLRAHSSWAWRSAALLSSCTRTTRVSHLRNCTPPSGRSTWLMASG